MATIEELKATCTKCTSGKPYIECCGKDELCPCGSGKKAVDCCMKSPETHQMGDAQ